MGCCNSSSTSNSNLNSNGNDKSSGSSDAAHDFPPNGESTVEDYDHVKDNTAVDLTAWKDKEPTVMTVLEMDLSSWASVESASFESWRVSCQEKIQGLLQYPSFRSVVCRSEGPKSFVWKEVRDLDVTQHIHVLSFSAENPAAHVLQQAAMLRDEYFDLNKPRWDVRIYRYADGDGDYKSKMRALFVLLRTGHMLADAVSMVSILLSTVFTAKPIMPMGFEVWIEKSEIAMPSTSAGDTQLQLARFDISWPEMKTLCADLKSAWNIARVTLTTLIHTVISRALFSIKGLDKDSRLWVAMPRDSRAGTLNRLKTAAEFNEQAREYADVLKEDNPNYVEGDAHEVQCLDVTKQDLEVWANSYVILEKALEKPHLQSTRKFLDEFMAPRNKGRLTQSFRGAIDYVLGSINAGPQSNSLANTAIGATTVLMYPTCCFERVIMLIRSGDRMGVGVSGPDATLLADAMVQGLQCIQELVTAWKFREESSAVI